MGFRKITIILTEEDYKLLREMAVIYGKESVSELVAEIIHRNINNYRELRKWVYKQVDKAIEETLRETL